MKPQQPPATQLELEQLQLAARLDPEAVCSICLCEWQEGAEEKQACQMPGCGHVFHCECITKWLGLCNSCPVCRLSIKVAQPEPGEEPEQHPVTPDSPRRVLAELLSNTVSSSDTDSDNEEEWSTDLQLQQRAALQAAQDWQLPPISSSSPLSAAALNHPLERATLRALPSRGLVHSRQTRRSIGPSVGPSIVLGRQMGRYEAGRPPAQTIPGASRRLTRAASLELPRLGPTHPQPSFGGINNSEVRPQLDSRATEEHRKRNARSSLPPIASQRHRNTSR